MIQSLIRDNAVANRIKCNDLNHLRANSFFVYTRFQAEMTRKNLEDAVHRLFIYFFSQQSGIKNSALKISKSNFSAFVLLISVLL